MSALAAQAPELVALRRAIGAVVSGKSDVIDLVIVAALAGGHVLLQDVPGVGKTTLAQALAHALGGRFQRVQFTADLLPADISGTLVLDRASGGLVFRPGPLFANVVLADEINRASPKTQSALFEAMEEGNVTIDGTCRPLPRPFLVLATQNPHDHHGTFPLPDSQLDRFLLRTKLGYPDREAEREVLRRGGARAVLEPVLDLAAFEALQGAAANVRVPLEVEDHLLDLVAATRRDARFVRGVSTRGAAALQRAAKARAFANGRSFVIPEDLRALAAPVLGHRVLLRSPGGAEAAEEAVFAVLSGLPRAGG